MDFKERVTLFVVLMLIGFLTASLLFIPHAGAHRAGNGDGTVVYHTPTPDCQLNEDNGLYICEID